MPTYAVAGITIATELELPELPAAPDGPASWTVVLDPAASAGPVQPAYELRTPDDDALWATLGAGEDRYLLSYERQVDFVVDARARTVAYVPAPGLAPNTLRHLLIDQVVPHLLAVDGELVLHASAVAVDGAVLAFIGPSGTGKSSMAAAHLREGALLVADDFLRLRAQAEGYEATPAYPGLRLWSDSAGFFAGDAAQLPPVADYTDKRRWAAAEQPAGAWLPLRAIVMLGYVPTPQEPVCRVAPLRGADAFAMLYQQAFRMHRAGREFQQADLDRFIRLAQRVPVLLIEHRRDFAVLPTVLADLHAALDEHAPRGGGGARVGRRG